MTFESDLEKKELCTHSDLVRGRDTYVFFGGLQGEMNILPYEFQFVSRSLNDVNKVYFRDVSQTWYHGVFNEVRDHLLDIVRRVMPGKLIFVGNSMGAYGALMFGSIFGADTVIMFSPQTCIAHKKKVLTWKDVNFESFIQKARDGVCYPHFFDLGTNPLPDNVHVYFGSDNKYDRLHSENIARDGVTLHPIKSDGHNVVKGLLEQKRLVNILKGDF